MQATSRNREGHLYTNDDWPSDNREHNPGILPPPIITNCRTYHTHLYNSDGTIFTDTEGIDTFEVIVPLGVNMPIHDEFSCTTRSSNVDKMRPTSNSGIHHEAPTDYAYWLIRSTRDNGIEGAIYGRVYHGRILKSLAASDGSLKWEITSDRIAIKTMQHDKIVQGMEVDGFTEDPYKEIAAMQYIQNHLTAGNQASQDEYDEVLSVEELKTRTEQIMMNHNIMTLIDALSSETHLFHVMPFCDGGDMFNLLDDAFPEPEARYFFKQILNAVETLQKVGICHRDISLENLVATRSGCVLAVAIDFGLCLRIPYIMNEHGNRQRCLMRVRRGKWGKVSCPTYTCSQIGKVLYKHLTHNFYQAIL